MNWLASFLLYICSISTSSDSPRSRVADPDPDGYTLFWEAGYKWDPHQRDKLDPDQYLSKIQELESLKMDVDAHNGGAEAQNGALKGL